MYVCVCSPAGEILVAVEKAGSSVQRVPSVVNGRTLWTQTHRQLHLKYSAWQAKLKNKILSELNSDFSNTHLFGGLVCSTQEYPLFCGCHLGAGVWVALALQFHSESIQLQTKLPVSDGRMVDTD